MGCSVADPGLRSHSPRRAEAPRFALCLEFLDQVFHFIQRQLAPLGLFELLRCSEGSGMLGGKELLWADSSDVI